MEKISNEHRAYESVDEVNKLERMKDEEFQESILTGQKMMQ